MCGFRWCRCLSVPFLTGQSWVGPRRSKKAARTRREVLQGRSRDHRDADVAVMDVPGLLRSVGIAAAGHPRVAEGRLGGPTLAPRNLSYLFDCRLVADAVEKIEKRNTPQNSQIG